MTIAERLLPKLSEWQPVGTGRQDWSQTLAETDWTLDLAADRVDTLGCLLWEMTLTRADAEPVANALLKEQALKAADRATGLMEPLHFLELDELRGQALLRSESPAKRGTALTYYEILMTAGREITVRRYRIDPEQNPRRDRIAFALTHEAIAKLVDDLVRG